MIPLLLSMDSDTLFNCGMASLRLYRLVCDPEVWRWLLKGIADFSKERVEQLVSWWSLSSMGARIWCQR